MYKLTFTEKIRVYQYKFKGMNLKQNKLAGLRIYLLPPIEGYSQGVPWVWHQTASSNEKQVFNLFYGIFNAKTILVEEQYFLLLNQ